MDFQYTEEQKMVRTNVHDFLEKEIVPIVDERDMKGPLSHEEVVAYRKKFEPIGLFTTDGGLGGEMDPICSAIMFEEVFGAWAGLSASIGAAGLAAMVALNPGMQSDSLRAKAQAGELVGCYALTEPNAGSDNRSMQAKAVLDGDYYVINGTKTWITNATIADVVLLMAKDENGQIQQFIVEKETSPFDSRELPKIGWHACPTGELYFDNCRVPKQNNLENMMMQMMISGQFTKQMEEEQASSEFAALSSLFSLGPTAWLFLPRANFGAAASGISQRAIDDSIKFSKERIQFGRPIAGFQLIQNMICEMVFQTESLRLLSYKAIQGLFTGDQQSLALASLVKSFGSEVAVRVTYLGVQVHGSVGISQELSMERYFRDAMVLTMPDGAVGTNKLMAGRRILGVTAYV